MGPAGNRGIQTALGTTGRGTVTVGPTKTGRARLAPEQPPADPSSASTGPTAEPSADAGKHSWRRKAWQVRTKVRLRKPHRAPDLHPVSYPGRRGRTRSSSTADRRKPFPGSAAPQKWDYQRLQARLHERRSGSTSCVGPATSDGRAKLEPKRRHRLESRVGGKVEDPGASFVKADPVPESTPDSALDSTLPKGWEVWWKSRWGEADLQAVRDWQHRRCTQRVSPLQNPGAWANRSIRPWS